MSNLPPPSDQQPPSGPPLQQPPAPPLPLPLPFGAGQPYGAEQPYGAPPLAAQPIATRPPTTPKSSPKVLIAVAAASLLVGLGLGYVIGNSGDDTSDAAPTTDSIESERTDETDPTVPETDATTAETEPEATVTTIAAETTVVETTAVETTAVETTVVESTVAETVVTTPTTAGIDANGFFSYDSGSGPLPDAETAAASTLLGVDGTPTEIYQRFSMPAGTFLVANGSLVTIHNRLNAPSYDPDNVGYSTTVVYVVSGTDAAATRDSIVTAISATGDFDITTASSTSEGTTVESALLGYEYEIAVAPVDGGLLAISVDRSSDFPAPLPPVPAEIAANPAVATPLAAAAANGTIIGWNFRIGLPTFTIFDSSDPDFDVGIEVQAPDGVVDDDEWINTLCLASGYEAAEISEDYSSCSAPDDVSRSWQSFVFERTDEPNDVSADLNLYL